MNEHVPSTGPSEADLARCVAYLHGTLDVEETKAFERRLGNDVELARAFEDIAAAHDSLRDALQHGTEAERSTTPTLRIVVTLAAGVLLAVGALAWYLRPQRSTSTANLAFQLAAVGTAPADADFNELLGFDPDWLPLGMGYRAEGETAPGADEYAAALTSSFQERVQDALLSDTPLRAPSFVVALRPDVDCHVVLVVNDARRGARRVLPRDTTPEPAYAGGRLHLLPGDPIRLPEDWRQSQRIDYRPGILTRGGADVVLALRQTPLTEAFVAELDELLALPESATSLRSWLADRGFTVREQRVDP